MTDQDLRKLNRKELLELLIASEKENTRLREHIQRQAAELAKKELTIQNAGTMAEAAIALNGVFEACDKAAAQYLENIKRRSEQIDAVHDRIVGEAEDKAISIVAGAEDFKQKMIREADEYWEIVKSQTKP